MTPLRKEWISALCSWIKNQEDLIYWSGNTFSGKEFTAKSIFRHLQKKNILPYTKSDQYGNLLAYGEIVKKNEYRLNLCRIIVHPDRRGEGLGKIFCRSMIEKCKTLGFHREIRLNVLSMNQPAIKCYSSLGFRIIGELPKSRKIGNTELDLIIMSKILNFRQ